MWESLLRPSRGGLSTRRIFTCVVSALLAVFLWTLLITFPAHADTKADATWNSQTIKYNTDSFTSTGDTTANDGSQLPVGAPTYTYKDTPKNEYDVIYFNVNQDPTTATSAHYVQYSIGTGNKPTNPQDKKDITIDPTGAAAASDNSCAIPGGLGWIICPLSNWLAGAVDWIFQEISTYVMVHPATVGDSHNDLYISWNIMRGIANIAFIIVFLIIIYSQLSNFGVDNYGIKKLLPRLIVAAILVNVSYYICAAAVDLSNILGYSIQTLFEGIRQNVFNVSGADANTTVYNFQSVTGASLSGVALATGGIAGVTLATAGSAVSAIYLLLPVLLGLVLAVLVVLLILAARQALIVILLIIAPVAFVANLLPNTEKWFKRWRELLLTMLIFFPAFSFVFAGAQVASAVIINSADSINTVILGLIVQVAPLVITPLLLRLSGDTLGKIAGVINNPRKGLVDRARNWSTERAEMHRQKSLTKPTNGNPFRAIGKGLDNGSRRVKERTALYTQMSENRYSANTRGRYNHTALNEMSHEAETRKKQIEATLESNLKAKILVTPHMLEEEMQLRQTLDTVTAANNKLDAVQESARAGRRVGGISQNLVNQSSAAFRDISISALTVESAKRVQQAEFTAALKASQELRVMAAGIDNDSGKGETRILANAKSQIEAEKDTLVKNIKIASDIKPGNVVGLANEFKKAIQQGNAEAARAYTDLLVEANNPGVIELRKVLSETEPLMPVDVMEELKTHINSSPATNAAAEDIVSWSRDTRSRTLKAVAQDGNTWGALTPAAFAGMKKSSQEAALRVGGISQDTAKSILAGPAFQNLKPDMKTRIEKLASGDTTYADNIDDPFTTTVSPDDED